MPHSSASRRRRRPSSAVSPLPSPAAGSSSRRTDGSAATARARATSRRRPKGSSVGASVEVVLEVELGDGRPRRGADDGTPGPEQVGDVGARRHVGRTRRGGSPAPSWSSNSSRCWNDRPIPAFARRRADHPLTSAPPTSTAPLAVANPVMASITVDLPAPFGPIRPSTSPGSTWNEHAVDRGDPAEADGEAVDRQAARHRRRPLTGHRGHRLGRPRGGGASGRPGWPAHPVATAARPRRPRRVPAARADLGPARRRRWRWRRHRATAAPPSTAPTT